MQLTRDRNPANPAFNAIITGMIPRRIAHDINSRLELFPAVALLGPRQVGKTTLARAIAASRESVYLDLENPNHIRKLADPLRYLSAHEKRLVVLDEVQRMPGLFGTLRGIIDEGRRRGSGTGRFLMSGSASAVFLGQSGESLAGRIAYLELRPFDVLELDSADPMRLWVRGGFPPSLLQDSEEDSFTWREELIRTYLERDIPQLGPRIPATTLRRLWTMLAHSQGQVLNASRLARSLSVDGKTVARYLDLLVDLLLVRRLPPYLANLGKRLVKSPKIYVRDSGVLHALLGLVDMEALLGHPVAGNSWEGHVIENILGAAPPRVQASFYRTADGAEIDLVLELPRGEIWAVEIKSAHSPLLQKGFHIARRDIQPDRSFAVYPGTERYPIADGIEAIGLRDLCREVTAWA